MHKPKKSADLCGFFSVSRLVLTDEVYFLFKKFIRSVVQRFAQHCDRQTRGILSQKCDTLTAPLLFLEVFFFSVKSLPVFLGKVNHL